MNEAGAGAPVAPARRVLWAAGLLLLVHALLIVLDGRAMGCTTDEPNYFNGARIILRHGWVTETTLFQGPLPLFANQLFVPDFPSGGFTSSAQRGLMVRGRWGTLPFALLSAALVFVWARRLFGDAGGLFALVVHALNPLLLGYGSLMLVDAQHAAVTLLALYVLWRWLETRAAWLVPWIGVTLGLALGTKYLAVLLAVPVGLTVAVAAARPAPGARGLRLASALGCVLQVVLAALGTLHALYLFREGMAPAEVEAYASGPMRSLIGTPVLGRLAALLPAPFLRGVDFQLSQGERDWEPFLNGVFAHGHGGYYAWSILCKTPEIVLLCTGLALVLRAPRLVRGQAPAGWRSAAVAILPFALLSFGYLSLGTSMQLGIRYVLPLLPLLWLATGALFWSPTPRPIGPRVLLACVLVGGLQAVELARNWPDWIAYYNSLSGGQRLAFRRFTSTNSDFGQYQVDGLERLRAEHGDFQVLGPTSGARFGRIAVDDDALRAQDPSERSRSRFEWLTWQDPIAHLGASWWLFELTPAALEQRVAERDDPRLRRDLALAYLGAGQRAQAEAELVRLPPELSGPLQKLLAHEDAARARPERRPLEAVLQDWRALGRPDRAEALALEHAATLADSEVALFARAQACEERKDYAGAVALLEREYADPADPTQLWLVRDLRKLGDLERAARVFRDIEQRLGDSPLTQSPQFREAKQELEAQQLYLELLR